MRIAYYSPLQPQATGISDYSEELLPHLARRAEVVLFVDSFQPSNPTIRRHFTIRDFNRQQPDDCDICLYHMGNNARFHAGIYRCLCRRPGVVVLHEWVLHNFFAGLTVRRGDENAYLREMEYNYGPLGHRLAQEFFRGDVPPVWEISPLRFPLNRRVIERSLGIIAHSRYVAERVRQTNALVPLARIAHGMTLPPPPPKFGSPDHACLRRRYRLPTDTPIVATFGYVNPWKRLDVLAGALSRLRVRCRFLFLIVGRTAGDYDARRVVAEAGIGDLTRFLQPTNLAAFNDLIAASDLAVNLRYPTLGETSGAVLRVLAAGRTSIVSDIGWFAELPDDCVVKIPPAHPAEMDLLTGFIERLLDDVELRQRLGQNARAYVAENHSWERAAEEYVAFLERVLHRPRRHLRAYEILRDLARELADIGLDPDDRWLLPDIARELADICLPSKVPARSEETPP